MRKRLFFPLLLVASALRADTLTQPVLEALTPIDALPTTTALDKVFNMDTAQNLQTIALSTDALLDFGVRLRAIRALPDYCPAAAACGDGTLAHDTLAQVIDGFKLIAVPSPRDVLRLRAAIEALGIAGVSAGQASDVARLVGFLDNASRDVRATTAKALGTLCNTNAKNPLQVRFVAEPTLQVQLAISAALRTLRDQCSGGM